MEALVGSDVMQEPLDALESRIAELRRAIRSALAAQDQERVRELRAELRRSSGAVGL